MVTPAILAVAVVIAFMLGAFVGGLIVAFGCMSPDDILDRDPS